jgi:hypothetical protein
LDISKFDIKDNINIDYMFSGCSDTLKKKIKSQNKKIKANAFEDDVFEDLFEPNQISFHYLPFLDILGD